MSVSIVLRRTASLALSGSVLLGAQHVQAAPVDPDGNLEHMRPLLEQTLETEKSGIEIRWSNPRTSHTGKIRVERTFFRDEQPCRDYIRTVTRPGQSGFVIRGTACRTGRSVWTIQDETVTETDAPRTRSSRAGSSTGTARTARSEPAPEGTREPAPAGRPPEAAAGSAAPEPAPAERSEPAPEAPPEPFVTFTMPSRSAL